MNSIAHGTTYGRQAISYVSRSKWRLPDFAIEEFDRWFLRRWTKDYVMSLIKDGALTHEGVTYQVAWRRSSGPASNVERYWLSFRVPNARWTLLPVVVIACDYDGSSAESSAVSAYDTAD